VLAMVRENTRRSKAHTVIKSIVHSCKSYASDYGKYPPIPGAVADGAIAVTARQTPIIRTADTESENAR
jgi:hypothetical protein